MASSLNKVTLIGNLGNDPEVRTMQSGSKLCSFSIATSESWKDKATGEKKEQTEWHRVSVFNEKLVEVIERYLTKGSKVYIEGKLQTRKYTDKNGVEKYSTEVVLGQYDGKLLMLGGKATEGAAGEPAKANGHQPEPAGLDDEVPF